jgi:hypothetical protein
VDWEVKPEDTEVELDLQDKDVLDSSEIRFDSVYLGLGWLNSAST